MSTTNEIGLYVFLALVLFCMLVSFLTFLKFEGENIRKEGVSFTLSGIFSFVKKTPFLARKKITQKAIKKIAFSIPFSNLLAAFFRRLKSIPKKIINYEWRLPVHWNFGNLILTVSVLFFCVLYGGYFWALQYGVSALLISSLLFMLVFLSLVIFSLQYGYEKTKYAFYFFVFLNVITVTFSPYFTADLFSSYSNVSPEKVTRLLYFMNVVAYVFCFYLLLYIVYYFLTVCLMCWKVYFFLYTKFDLFIENPKQNAVRLFFTGDWSFLLLFLSCLSVPFIVFGSALGSPTYRFEQIMAEYMFTENNGRCGGLEDDDKIYFYEMGRVLKYVPKDVDKEADKEQYGMKYMDYQCKNETKEKPTEAKVKENTVL